LLVYFRINDAAAALHNVGSYQEHIYEDVQLAARRFLASRTLDAILSDRNELSDAVRDAVRESAGGYGVEIYRADVNDLVFPGNLREIMNRVLETQRRAEAALIEARKDAEAMKIKTEAETQAQREQVEAERARIQIAAEGELELTRLRVQASLEEAQALAEHPELVRLRELQALEKMAVKVISPTKSDKMFKNLLPPALCLKEYSLQRSPKMHKSHIVNLSQKDFAENETFNLSKS
jgi:regulator of protease activity HflC (stomatin/prohibitin superfamily)